MNNKFGADGPLDRYSLQAEIDRAQRARVGPPLSASDNTSELHEGDAETDKIQGSNYLKVVDSDLLPRGVRNFLNNK